MKPRKRTLSLTLVLVLLLGLTACGAEQTAEQPEQTPAAVTQPTQPESEPDPEPEDASLTQLRDRLTEGDYLCAIAYLGKVEDPANLSALLQSSDYAAEYPFLTSIPQDRTVAYEGTEAYCLVPRDPSAEVTVQEFISNAANQYQGELGKTLYHSDQGSPVILIGNVSDVIPNLQVTLTGSDGETLVYNPSLSMCDGTVDLPVSPKVYDFSCYQPQETSSTSTGFLGAWQAEGGKLTFSEDGTMSFAPAAAGEMAGTFYVITNSSQYPAGSVLFEMTRDGDTDFWGIFTLTRSGSTLTVTHVSGDQLLDSQTVTFTAAS